VERKFKDNLMSFCSSCPTCPHDFSSLGFSIWGEAACLGCPHWTAHAARDTGGMAEVAEVAETACGQPEVATGKFFTEMRESGNIWQHYATCQSCGHRQSTRLTLPKFDFEFVQPLWSLDLPWFTQNLPAWATWALTAGRFPVPNISGKRATRPGHLSSHKSFLNSFDSFDSIRFGS